ncbi:hypothetical protein DL346_19820 [Paenibacillus montanisoli]|uniref:Uncharacterized protein n=1 Tax=Paenibacillus montanisoli TaxID=2081970 RepID=A0A328U0F9_9BACL|nr:hypothetical protein DL346_19820 [Paenibacillus montanisoli]
MLHGHLLAEKSAGEAKEVLHGHLLAEKPAEEVKEVLHGHLLAEKPAEEANEMLYRHLVAEKPVLFERERHCTNDQLPCPPLTRKGFFIPPHFAL